MYILLGDNSRKKRISLWTCRPLFHCTVHAAARLDWIYGTKEVAVETCRINGGRGRVTAW